MNVNFEKRIYQPVQSFDNQLTNNCNFMYKGDTLFHEKLITCGILRENDLLNEEGTLKSLSNFSNCIENKSEWLCEFRIRS